MLRRRRAWSTSETNLRQTRHAQSHETSLPLLIDFQNGPAYPKRPFQGPNDDSGVHAAATSATHGPSSASSRHFTSLRQTSRTISAIYQCRRSERRHWTPRPASLNRAAAHSGYSKGAQSHLPRLLCSTSTLHTTHSRLHHLTPTFSCVASLIETLQVWITPFALPFLRLATVQIHDIVKIFKLTL